MQEWYDSLCEADQDEISDTVNHLASMPVTEWKRPESDKVVMPLAEIRCKSSGTNHTIRLYGVFDEKIRVRFMILNAIEAKKTGYDKAGQDLAQSRLALLRSGKGPTHEFAFERGASKPNPAQQGSPNKARVLEFGQGRSKPD